MGTRHTPTTDAAAVAALFECDAELEALERALLAWCVHAGGSGAEEACLLRWLPAREAFVVVARASAGATASLAEAVARARRGPSVPTAGRIALASVPETWRAAWQTFASEWGGPGPMAPGGEDAAVALVPLARAGFPHALLVATWSDGEARPGRLAGLEVLRAVAASALTAQARAAEARRRARLAAGVAELAATLPASINVAEAQHILLRLAVQGLGARGGALWTVGPEHERRLAFANGPAALRERFAMAFAPAVDDALRQGRVLAGASGAGATGLAPDVAGEVTTWAIAPLLVHGEAAGALLVWDAGEGGEAGAELDRVALDHLTTLAHLGATLIAHGRALEARAAAVRDHEELRRRLHAQDQLATLGELATRVAREARNPLASIGAFARRAHRALPEGDPQREYLEIVIREATRLEAMVQEQLAYAELERPRLQIQDLNAVVQDALKAAGESLVRRRVRLVKKLAPDLPALLLDAARMRRVVENVLGFALENVLVGGRIRVESRRAGGYAVVEVAHDGPRTAGDLLEHLFVPFASGAAGAAIGLGVAQQIVREHGGEIRVRSEGEWSAIFSCTLPVRENEDRRRRTDRRSGRNDRRRRPAA